MARSLSLVDAVGTATVGWISYVLEIAALVGLGIARLVSPGGTRPVTRTVLRKQVLFTGIQAVPFIAFLALLTAASLVVQAQVGLAGFVQSDLFGHLLVVVLVREVGPLIIALVVIARSGTAIAAEMANMQVAQEVRGLELAGIDPFDYLVIPRLGGVCLAVMCLTLLYIAVSLAGGYVMAHAFQVPGAPDSGQFITMIARNLSPSDLWVVPAKTVVPGLLIAAIACREGLHCGTSVTAVPRATTQGVVRSITAVFLWDALITTVTYSV
jgi:phospholipid/cholesterol/gamma-HCH transport system permease protein